MKDENDSYTADFLSPKDHTMFKINFSYAINNVLRTGSLVFQCNNAKEAEKLATDKLKDIHPWFKITRIIKL